MSQKRVAVISDHMKIYAGRELERGQVFELANQLNDSKLLGWNYVRELESKEETYTCKCGREFLGAVTDPATRAHNIKWQGQCSPAIEVDGIQLKGRGPRARGGGDPDANDGVGWDPGVGDNEGPVEDPYAGKRIAGGKEVPKRVTLGG